MPHATVQGIPLHYVEEGAGPPIVLVHGFPLDHQMWRGQIGALAARHRVIAPDLRGFGRSGVTSGVVSMEQFADDVAELLDVLGIVEPVVFAGLSMGGYIAWQFWARHAARLAKLILCDTRAAADSPETARGRLVTAEQVLANGPTNLVATMLGRLFAPETAQEQPGLVEATRQVMLGADPSGIAAALRGMAARPDMSGRLSEIHVPTLVLCGEQDVISPVAEMRGMTRAIPQGVFVEIPTAGHMAPLEKPTVVNEAIWEFLATSDEGEREARG